VVPCRVICGLVKNTAISGSFKENPFLFDNFGLKKIELTVDDVPSPAQPMNLNFTNNNYVDAYAAMYHGLNKTHEYQNCGITLYDFANGYAFYVFNLNNTDEGINSKPRQGNTKINLELTTAPTQTLTLIVYAITPKTLLINEERLVSIE
jgi:hypothetical protein